MKLSSIIEFLHKRSGQCAVQTYEEAEHTSFYLLMLPLKESLNISLNPMSLHSQAVDEVLKSFHLEILQLFRVQNEFKIHIVHCILSTKGNIGDGYKRSLNRFGFTGT